MPSSNNRYTAPTWVNDNSPYINASELQAISDAVEDSQFLIYAVSVSGAWTTVTTGVYSKTITVPNVDTRSVVNVRLDRSTATTLQSAGVRSLQAVNESGTIKLYATGVAPSSSFSIYCLVTEVVNPSGFVPASIHGDTYVFPFNGGTLSAQLITGGAQTISTAQARNIYAGTADMVDGSTALATGTVYLQYE